ncbi:MAG TPA: SusC/RagA family TonB-linked outer membrane protein [Flavobacterium sp.]|jgi:TonB-linked SusC/RagA family outer membrane protein
MNKNLLIIFLIFTSLILTEKTYAQTRKITGTVRAKSDGMTVPGATVMVKNSTRGTSTNIDGSFTLEVSGNNDVLVVSMIGFATVEKTVGSNNELNITLAETAEQLGNVVVNTGYQRTTQRTFTGATSKISEKELNVEGITDVSRMIEGKAAGITVQNVSGTFGTAPKITVRGSASIFGDARPLWVIDGIVQEDIINVSFADLASGNSETLLSSSVAGLNPNDVLSVEILKDASATSIYGSRALNGVVVVTTKQGKRESPLTINYTGDQSIRPVPNYNQYDILNSQESMSIFKELEDKGFLDLPSTFQSRYGGVFTLMARNFNSYDPVTGIFTVRNDQEDDGANRNAFLRKYELANTNWFKTLFRPSVFQNHSLSFSGGGKNNAYFASLAYFSDPGWTIADKVNQLAVNLKNTFYINDKFNLTLSSQVSVRDQQVPGSYNSQTDTFFGSTTRDFDINPFNFVLNTSRTLRPYDDNGSLEYSRANWAPFNIINELQNNYMEVNVKDIRFQADVAYTINPALTYNATVNARYVNSTRDHNILENSNIVGAYKAADGREVRLANVFLYQDPRNPGALPVSVLPNGGILRAFTNKLTSYNLRNTLTYKKTFNDKHEFDSFIGQEIRLVDRSNNNFTAFGLQYDRGLTAFTDPRILEKLINQGDSYFGFNEERERAVGIFGKVNYTYDRRYTASVTGRYDGSNRQGRSNSSRWLPTYTFSGKWNIKEESFMKDINSINTFAVRGSYGLTATAGPATNSLAIYKSFITDRFSLTDREIALNIEALQNSELTWEKQFETNIGLDLGLFGNRVQVTTDVFNRKAFDLVDFVNTSGIGGQQIRQGNNADMNTKGFEFAITTNNLGNTKVRWTTNLNFTLLKQEITKIQSIPTAFNLIRATGGNVIGRPRNSLYSYQFTGLNNQGLPTFVMADGVTDNVTGANFQDSENVTKYLKYEGSTEPTQSAGITNTISYENWTFSFQVVGSGGNKIRLNPIYSNRYNDLTVFTKDFANRWVNPGDEAITNIPVIADEVLISNYRAQSKFLERAYNAYNYSDQRVADGSFIRLKNVSLGYEFPKQLKKDLHLNTFTFKVSSANTLLIYADKKLNGQDPEFFRSGGVSQPITGQYTFTINVGF